MIEILLLTTFVCVYLAFGAGLLLGVYLSDEDGDRPGLRDQILIGLCVVLGWPIIVAALHIQERRAR